MIIYISRRRNTLASSMQNMISIFPIKCRVMNLQKQHLRRCLLASAIGQIRSHRKPKWKAKHRLQRRSPYTPWETASCNSGCTKTPPNRRRWRLRTQSQRAWRWRWGPHRTAGRQRQCRGGGGRAEARSGGHRKCVAIGRDGQRGKRGTRACPWWGPVFGCRRWRWASEWGEGRARRAHVLGGCKLVKKRRTASTVAARQRRSWLPGRPEMASVIGFRLSGFRKERWVLRSLIA